MAGANVSGLPRPSAATQHQFGQTLVDLQVHESGVPPVHPTPAAVVRVLGPAGFAVAGFVDPEHRLLGDLADVWRSALAAATAVVIPRSA
jgi:hypothetical protein